MSAEVTTVECELQQTKLIDTFNLTSIYLYYLFFFSDYSVSCQVPNDRIKHSKQCNYRHHELGFNREVYEIIQTQ